MREVRFLPNIGTHDLEAKTRKVKELIGEGAKVKLTVRFRGREATHQQIGLSVLKRVADDLKEVVRLEKPPAMEGRALSMILIPTVQRQEKPEKPVDESKESEVLKEIEELTDAKT